MINSAKISSSAPINKNGEIEKVEVEVNQGEWVIKHLKSGLSFRWKPALV